MKRGYKKLLIFEILLILILILNSFVWNILKGYVMIGFLLLLIVLFMFFFGIEKDRHRYVKDIIFDMVILLLGAFLLYYLTGIFFGFYRVDNYYTLYGIMTFILSNALLVCLKEYLRYQVFNKSEGNKTLVILSCVLFILFDLTSSLHYADFSSVYNAFMFFALTFIPMVSINIAASYITMKVGYKPNLVWRLVTTLYVYMLPMVPNPNEYILSLIRFAFPLLLAYRVHIFFAKEKDREVDRNYKKRNILVLMIPSVFMLVVIYLTSGYFKYSALAIASGSMSPNINKGDVVIYEKIDSYDSLKIGDVIVYKYDNVVVVHRIINIINEDGYYFYTKGDNNNSLDNVAVKEDMLIGIVKGRLPYIGLPTVWLNGL